MARRFCFQLSTLKLLRCEQPGGVTTSSASMASLSGSGRETMGGKARPRAVGGEGDEDDASAARGLLGGAPRPAEGRTLGQSAGRGQRWCCAALWGRRRLARHRPRRTPEFPKGGARRGRRGRGLRNPPAGRSRRTAQALAALRSRLAVPPPPASRTLAA